MCILLLFMSSVHADVRPFSFLTDLYPEGRGGAEYEQWISWESRKRDDKGFNRFDFQHEFEFGLLDAVDLGLYAASWDTEKSKERDSTEFNGAGFDNILYLSNPLTDFLGFGFYNEVMADRGNVSFEQKLILQKDWTNWTLLYNAIFETKVERVGGENEVGGEITHAIGASYSFNNIRAGAEMKIESEYEDWNDYEGTAVWLGPALTADIAEWLWLTLTPTVLVSDRKDEPAFVTRLIIGVPF